MTQKDCLCIFHGYLQATLTNRTCKPDLEPSFEHDADVFRVCGLSSQLLTGISRYQVRAANSERGHHKGEDVEH
jgi:hypothetical protein